MKLLTEDELSEFGIQMAALMQSGQIQILTEQSRLEGRYAQMEIKLGIRKADGLCALLLSLIEERRTEPCGSCRGLGYFDSFGKPTDFVGFRECLDCKGAGIKLGGDECSE